MTLGMPLEIQPFIDACNSLRACVQPRLTLMPAAPFLSAAEDLYDALGPEYLPGFPDHLREELRQIIDILPKDQISGVLAGVTLKSLREKNLFPSRDIMASEAAVRSLLESLIPSEPGTAAAEAVVKGAIEVHKPAYRPTMRGLYEIGDGNGEHDSDSLVFGMMGPDGQFVIARPSRLVGQLALRTSIPAASLPPPPQVETPRDRDKDLLAKTAETPLAAPQAAESAFPLPSPFTDEHRAGVNWNVFFSSMKSGRLPPNEPILLSTDEELFFGVCLEKHEDALATSAQAVEEFQINFLNACRDRPDLLGVLLRAVQKGIIDFATVAQMTFDALQKSDVPLVDIDNRLLTFREIPLTRGNLRLQMPSRSDYTLGKEIGRGGTSRVYRAGEVGPDRDVAIKIVTIPNAGERERLYQCFEAERKKQAIFSSERFVHVYSTGWTTQGNPYIAMEICEEAVADYLEDVRSGRKPFDLNRALDLARQMVSAVAEMHMKDHVHRDIKPENFFLKNGRVKLGDLALSKHQNELPKTPQLEPWGTPGYIAPEIANAQAPEGKTNDTFALGVVLYELFTGVFCFEGLTPSACLINSISNNPPLPSRVAPGRNIPESIDQLIMKCLEKDPANRYEDALGVLHDLVTVRAKALVEEALASRRKSHHTGADIRINLDIWHDRMKEALRELRRVYDDFPLPSILQERISLNKELFDWADAAGETEELIAIRDSILALDRELQGRAPDDVSVRPFTDAAKAVSQNIQYDIRHDEEVSPRSNPRYHILSFEEQGGYLELAARVEKQSLSSRPASSPRGRFNGLRFTSLDHMPVYQTLPPRPSMNGQPYPVRIPTYRLTEFHPELRDKLVIIPAGGAAAMRPPTGKIAQPIEEIRLIDHDIGVLPLPTNRDYYGFLQWIYEQNPSSLQLYLPQGWKQLDSGEFVTAHGGPIDWDLPIQTNRMQNQAYLNYLTQKFERPFRNCSLFEWKLLARGAADGRPWSWGNAIPEKGTTVMRFGGPDTQLEPVNMPHLRDLAPDSIPKIEGSDTPARLLTHVIGNTFKRLHLTDEEKHRIYEGRVFRSEIENMYGSYSWQNFARFLRENDVLAGVAYDHEPPQTPDGLKSRPHDFHGSISFFPVTELRPVDTSSWAEAMTGRKPSDRPSR